MKNKQVIRKVSAQLSNGKVEKHLRLREAASLLGVSRPTLYRLLGRIRHVRINAGGLDRVLILIPESALAEFLRGAERQPEATQ